MKFWTTSRFILNNNYYVDFYPSISMRDSWLGLRPCRAVNRISSRWWHFESRRLWGPKAPHKRGVWGGWCPQQGTGAEPLWSKMNLMFDITKNWLSLSILNKFWSGWLIKNSRHPSPPRKILISRALQMPFPAFSRGISWGGSNDDHLPFGILETTVKKLSSKPCRLFAAILWMHMAFQSHAMSHWNVM